MKGQAAYQSPQTHEVEGPRVWSGSRTTELAKNQERNQAKSSGREQTQETGHGEFSAAETLLNNLEGGGQEASLAGSVVRNPPANAGAVGSIPDLGGSHTPGIN